ncbi:DMT family transporter [uncultured Roseobacter sp.]|uniref:DMT family transporter n=1 Tax=uncultured Roseobacter sp. TaxID=114847 RepID=UPI00260D4944|nr:DMT family transporter [uncultured Roseobacter sp.]
MIMSDTRTAVIAIVLSVAALSLGDAVIKGTGLSLPLWQMFILRSSLIVPILFWLARRKGPIAVRSIYWATLRSALLVLMWLSYYSSLPLMPLSLAAAAYYSGPLFIVGLSAVVSRTWPSGRAILAIAAGFIGVVLVIRPDTAGMTLGTLLPVAAGFLYACAMVLTSAKCREDDPLILALALNITFIVSGAVLGLFSDQDGSVIFGPWQAVDLQLLATVAALAVLILIGSVGAAIAYQKGPAGTVAAIDYSYLVFSMIWGGLFFAEFPSMVGLLGVSIIATAGFSALPTTRQRKLSRNG